MGKWEIIYNRKPFYPALLNAAVKQPNPVLKFVLGKKKFSIEFKNRTDHRGSETGHHAEVEMISNDRSKRVIAIASFKKDLND